jgi:hypothetical protein
MLIITRCWHLGPNYFCLVILTLLDFTFIFFLLLLLMQGFSMVSLCQKDKVVLVAFGGNRKEPSAKVKHFCSTTHLHICPL